MSIHRRENLRWTDEMKLILSKEVNRNKAYKKTEQSMEVKWKSILDRITLMPQFIGISCTWQTLQTQYNRFKDDVLKELQISEEGANLSGLANEPSEFQYFNQGSYHLNPLHLKATFEINKRSLIKQQVYMHHRILHIHCAQAVLPIY